MEGTAKRSRRRRRSKSMPSVFASQATKLSSGFSRFPNVSKIYSALVAKKQEDALADRRHEILLAVAKIVGETGTDTYRGDSIWKRRELKDVASMLGMDYTEVKDQVKEGSAIFGDNLAVFSAFSSGPLLVEQSPNILRMIKKHRRGEQLQFINPLRQDCISTASYPQWNVPLLQWLNDRINAVCAEYTTSSANYNEVRNLTRRIKTAINSKIPNINVNVDLYGSRGYGICNDSSDVDMVITSATGTTVPLDQVFRVLKRLAGCRSAVHLAHARSPIIRFSYFNRQNQFLFQCDVSCENRVGLGKTRLISQYMRFDPRVAKVLTMVKIWGKKRQIADSNTLNSYGIMMMVLAYLISCKVVPPLQLINSSHPGPSFWTQHEYLLSSAENVNAVYTDNITTPERVGPATTYWRKAYPFLIGAKPEYYYKGNDASRWVSPNTQTVTELLYGFFHYYGNVFDPLTQAVSPRLGAIGIPRSYLQKLIAPDWKPLVNSPGSWHNKMRPLAIEDVFEPTVNCGRNAPPSWVVGFLWEMRRAAWILTPTQTSYSSNFSPIDRLIGDHTSPLYGSPIAWAPVYTTLLTWLEKTEKKGAAVTDSYWKQYSLINPENNKRAALSNRRR
ncbi:Zinc finger, CCHC domain-containing protein [Coemansia interrupta]|uniref:polynucleotide adenylyltransferase n=1 Tax=Coemansia interrupta TaxID=1126814 RepID=A0A9W8LK10_9FUNG|nr:Zinc finger, CCHC domain-containing protein [Coemansia interrupta]